MIGLSGSFRYLAVAFLAVAVASCATKAPKEKTSPDAAPTKEGTAAKAEAPPKPGTAQAAYKRANALFDEKRYDEARAAYEEALRLDPNHQAACANLGLCLKRLGRMTDALDAYREALRLDPKDAQTRENYVYALEDTGLLVEAARELRTMVEQVPEDAYFLKHLATILIYLDQTKEATEFYERAFKITPGTADDYYNLGLCYFNQENWESALTTWLTATAYNPKHQAANKGLAVAYWKRGDYDKAWEAVTRCGTLGIVVDAAFLAALEKDSGKKADKQ